MSLEHHPARNDPSVSIGMDGSPRGPPSACDYWDALINETEAAAFLGLEPRTMQGYRYRGDGPEYVALSKRCIRYTRRWLRDYALARLRTSTSDQGQEGATS